jgi:hypothetical protein
MLNEHPLYYKAPVQVLAIFLFFRSVVAVTPGREFMKYPGYKFEKLETHGRDGNGGGSSTLGYRLVLLIRWRLLGFCDQAVNHCAIAL